MRHTMLFTQTLLQLAILHERTSAITATRRDGRSAYGLTMAALPRGDSCLLGIYC
jgi:hypothetical protein